MTLCSAVVIVALPRGASAYRTAGDLADFSGTSRVAVPTPPLRFRMVMESMSLIESIDLDNAAKRAVATWNAPDCVVAPLSFEGSTLESAQPNDGASTIEWVTDWAARGFAADAAANTDVQYVRTKSGEWQIAEADIYLNTQFNWSAFTEITASSEAAGAPEDVQAVLTHEMGHAVGLLHPCEVVATADAPACTDAQANACMNPVYNVHQRALSDDDIAGICFLYPAPNCQTAGCPDGQACNDQGLCVDSCGSEVCSGSEVFTDHGCLPAGSCRLSSCVGEACAADADCAFREFCVAEVCTVGTSSLGDPCQKDAECSSGACLSGSCAASCSSDIDCPSGTECDADVAACRDSLRPFGDACTNPLECRGGACLVENMAQPVCTRPCGDALPACPSGYSCRVADGEPVCAPEHLSVQGGCALSPAPNANSTAFAWFVALGLASLLIRRTRARTTQISNEISGRP